MGNNDELMARYILYTKTNKRLMFEVLDDLSKVRTNAAIHEVFTGTEKAFVEKAGLESIGYSEDQFKAKKS